MNRLDLIQVNFLWSEKTLNLVHKLIRLNEDHPLGTLDQHLSHSQLVRRENLKPEEIDFVERYQDLFSRIKIIQTRMDVVEEDMRKALIELENLRELEKQQNKQNGKK